MHFLILSLSIHFPKLIHPPFSYALLIPHINEYPSLINTPFLATRYAPLRRLCTLLSSQQKEYYNLQRAMYEQKVREQLLVYHKPGLGQRQGLAPGLGQEPAPGPGLGSGPVRVPAASAPSPGLVPGSGPARVPVLSWDEWLHGKLRDKHQRDNDAVYQEQQVELYPTTYYYYYYYCYHAFTYY